MYNNGEKSWDKFALLKLLRTGQSNSHTTRIQLHLASLSPTPHTKLACPPPHIQSWKLVPVIGYLRVAFASVPKRVFVRNHSYEIVFHLQAPGVLYREAPPRDPTPYLFIYHFFRKGTPFKYLLKEAVLFQTSFVKHR